MKASRIIWPILLIVTGFTCLFSWLTIPQPGSQPRIKVESELTYFPGMYDHSSASCFSYDPYFTHVNDFRQILIPVSKPK